MGFAALIVVLVASIPVLAVVGYRLVTSSTDGTFGKGRAAPSDPGYEELVTSTPTALVVQTDAQGTLVGVTFLALGTGSQGGAVIFMPVDTLTPIQGFGVDRLSNAFAASDNTQERVDLVAANAADILNVGLDEVISLDAQGWANAVAPVAPFEIQNLDSLTIDGTPLSVGTVPIGAKTVGPYLAVQRPFEPEASRIARQVQFWQGWLRAVQASDKADAVPGESASGLGLFVRTLAKGAVRYETLPGSLVAGPDGGYAPNKAAVGDLVSATVPVPDAATPGSRRTVRLLNGVGPDPIPLEVTRQVTAAGGSVTVAGNGPRFGQDETTIVYADPANEAYARILQRQIGAKGSVTRQLEAPDNIDVTVVLGRDVLGDQPATASSTSSPTEGN